MGVEIERKFLVDPEAFRTATGILSIIRLNQGYLSNDPCIRVRCADTKSWITVKGPGGLVRSEWEYEIPLNDGLEMFDTLCRDKLVKNRHTVSLAGHVWVIDQFLGSLKELWMAEIELRYPRESFEKPSWITEEVTGDERYSNVWLAKHGLPKKTNVQ